MNTTTISSGAVATTTCAQTRVWRLRPVTRRLAALAAPIQGTTPPVTGSIESGPAAAIVFTADKYMDVPPFRTGRPPV